MNIELEEVVVQDVSVEALELAAGGAQGGVQLVQFNSAARTCQRTPWGDMPWC